jgi:hypothetical protein
MISPNSPPTVYIIEFWRRTLEGREYVSSRLFSEFCKAKKYLIRNGYRPLDENVFDKDDLRAIITERTIE